MLGTQCLSMAFLEWAIMYSQPCIVPCNEKSKINAKNSIIYTAKSGTLSKITFTFLYSTRIFYYIRWLKRFPWRYSKENSDV